MANDLVVLNNSKANSDKLMVSDIDSHVRVFSSVALINQKNPLVLPNLWLNYNYQPNLDKCAMPFIIKLAKLHQTIPYTKLNRKWHKSAHFS